MTSNPDAILLIPRLRLINCNAISSPATWGFPAISAFAGFAEALNRKIKELGYSLSLRGVGVVCNEFHAQVSPGQWDHLFHQTRNPLEKKGRDVVSASMQEEGRCNLTVGLVIGVYDDDEDQAGGIGPYIMDMVQTMRVAGGSVLPRTSKDPDAEVFLLPDKDIMKKLLPRLMPGFALVGRGKALAAHVEKMRGHDPEATSLDALLDMIRLNSTCREVPAPTRDKPDHTEAEWSIRKEPGWLVPIPVGFIGISELFAPGKVQRCRDPNVPAQFVEAVYSLGEWIGPHRIKNPEQLLWFHEYREDEALYLLTNAYEDILQEEGDK